MPPETPRNTERPRQNAERAQESPVDQRFALSNDVMQGLTTQVEQTLTEPDGIEKQLHIQQDAFLTRIQTVQQDYAQRIEGQGGLRSQISTLFLQTAPLAEAELMRIIDTLLEPIPTSGDAPETRYLSRQTVRIRKYKGEPIYHYAVTNALVKDISMVEKMMKNASPEQQPVLQQIRDMLIVYGQQDKVLLSHATHIDHRINSTSTRGMTKMLKMSGLLIGTTLALLWGIAGIAQSWKKPTEMPGKLVGPAAGLAITLFATCPELLKGVFSGKDARAVQELCNTMHQPDFRKAVSSYGMHGATWRNATETLHEQDEPLRKVIGMTKSGTITDQVRQDCADALIPEGTDPAAHASLLRMLQDPAACEAWLSVARTKDKKALETALEFIGSEEFTLPPTK